MKKDQRITLIENIIKLKANIMAVDREDVIDLSNDQWDGFKEDISTMIDGILIGVIDMKGTEKC